MQHTLIEELHTPTKVYKKFYVFDLCFVILYFFFFAIFLTKETEIDLFLYIKFSIISLTGRHTLYPTYTFCPSCVPKFKSGKEGSKHEKTQVLVRGACYGVDGHAPAHSAG